MFASLDYALVEIEFRGFKEIPLWCHDVEHYVATNRERFVLSSSLGIPRNVAIDSAQLLPLLRALAALDLAFIFEFLTRNQWSLQLVLSQTCREMESSGATTCE